MINCPNCNSDRPESARFCDECGARLTSIHETSAPAYVAPVSEPTVPADQMPAALSSQSNVTSIGIPAVEAVVADQKSIAKSSDAVGHATLTIERGDSPGTIFELITNDSIIGRWDADNGIFPEIDLDAYDPDAKVSRRHARIVSADGKYFVEDLGSTNGTYINRGRRLLPGTPQQIADGDEVIVGKTFLRFKIKG